MTAPIPTLFVIPTGIGCSVGGHAGDALPAARLLAAVSQCLITHPNVMNGAALYWSDPYIQYVEGFGLDRFAAGEIFLRPVRQQRIGMLLDSGIEAELQQRHVQVLDGCRSTLGLNIGPIVATDAPLKINFHQGRSGASWGTLGNPDVLLNAGDRLKEAGATAIAVVTKFPDFPDNAVFDEYRKGKGVDPSSGAEAVISHLLVRHLSIPCAHSPAMTSLPIDLGLDPRAAGEELGHTFLPCVLVGLSRAPDLLPVSAEASNSGRHSSGLDLHIDQIGAVVAPYGALGGNLVLSCLSRRIPLIAVSNPGALSVTPESLGLKTELQLKDEVCVLHAQNYVEAAGLVTLLREGIAIESLYRPIKQTLKMKGNSGLCIN